MTEETDSSSPRTEETDARKQIKDRNLTNKGIIIYNYMDTVSIWRIVLKH